MGASSVSEMTRNQCETALRKAGATPDQCHFYADAWQCEHEMLFVSYKHLTELRDEVNKVPLDVTQLLTYIIKLFKNFNKWRASVENLSKRRDSIPPLDLKNHADNQLMKAICSIQTKQVTVLPGDELRVLDASQPNMLKIRNERGEEGYIPALCCLLPSPDHCSLSTVERLQIHLLACWSDCESKLRSLIERAIQTSTDILVKKWANVTSGNERRGIIEDRSWECRVSRRLKRLTEASISDQSALDLNRLRKIFCSLENELIWQNSEKLGPMIEALVSLDKVVLSYQAFRKQWRNYRQSLRDSATTPINTLNHWDPQIFSNSRKLLRYYEVKLTAEEILTQEETTYITPPKPLQDAAASGASQRQSVAAEQLTSCSHEENKKFVIRAVVDPKTGQEISIQEAVESGIMDHKSGMYRNPSTGASKTISQAMNEGLIKVEYVTTTRTAEKVESIGLFTIKTQIDNREYTITNVIDSESGIKVDLHQARQNGLINDVEGHYIDSRTGKKIGLDEAIDAGWVLVEYDKESENVAPHFETKTYAISAVVDQKLFKPVPFLEAIRRGLIDRVTGNYINNVTGERVYAADAIRRGFFKSKVVEDPSTLNIDATNRVMVERIDKVRKNVLRSVKVLAAFNHALAKKDEKTKKATTTSEPA